MPTAARHAVRARPAPSCAPDTRERRNAEGFLQQNWPSARRRQQSVATSGAELGAALFAYHIDVPVSIPRQQSAMIPFTASEVAGRARLRLQRSACRSDHPLSGVRLKNTTALHLMGGPLTVFDARATAAMATSATR